MDQTKSADSVSSAPVGERIAGDAAPPSSMNDLEALDIVKVGPAPIACTPFCSLLGSGVERIRNSRLRPQSC